MARTQRTAREMYPVIETYLKSGRTQKDFCAEHELSKPVFAYWLARYRRQDGRSDAPAFFEVSLPAAHEPVAEIDFPGGVRIRLFTPVGPEYLAALLRAA
jgi:hypothetical protein